MKNFQLLDGATLAISVVCVLNGMLGAGGVGLACPQLNNSRPITDASGTLSASSSQFEDGQECVWLLQPSSNPNAYVITITSSANNISFEGENCEIYVNGIAQCEMAGDSPRTYCEKGSTCTHCQEIQNGSFPLKVRYSPKSSSGNRSSEINLHYTITECNPPTTETSAIADTDSTTAPHNTPANVGQEQNYIITSEVTTQLMPVLVIVIIVIVGIGVVFRLRRRKMKMIKRYSARRKSIRESIRRPPPKPSSVFYTANEEITDNNNKPTPDHSGAVEEDSPDSADCTTNSSARSSGEIIPEPEASEPASGSNSNIDWQTLYKKNMNSTKQKKARKYQARSTKHPKRTTHIPRHHSR